MSSQLRIVIVGAGLSGLAAAVQCALSGHKVTVLESAKELAEIGAGLQLTPNATRLLQAWDVYSKIHGPCEPSTCTVYNYKGTVLAHEDAFDQNIRRKYSAPFTDVRRSDLHMGLVDRAAELGVDVYLNAKVANIEYEANHDDHPDSKGPRVHLENSAIHDADLVVGADGLWSTCRSLMLGKRDAPLPTGDLAYRIVLNISQIHDEKLRKMVQEPGVRFWVGPDAHVVAYSMRGGAMYNVVLLVPDDLPGEVSREEGSVEQMQKLFEGWDPVLSELLGCVKKVDKWKLMHRQEMESWVNDKGNLVLMGDACHPMLPYLAQGANSSIEDGAVLGLLLAPERFEGREKLPETLKLFEKLRKDRGEAIARETFKQRKDFHLRDGPEQQARDKLFAKYLGKGEIEEAFPSRWTCPEVQPWLYGYNAFEEVEAAVQKK